MLCVVTQLSSTCGPACKTIQAAALKKTATSSSSQVFFAISLPFPASQELNEEQKGRTGDVRSHRESVCRW